MIFFFRGADTSDLESNQFMVETSFLQLDLDDLWFGKTAKICSTVIIADECINFT